MKPWGIYTTVDHGVRHGSPHGLTHGPCHGFTVAHTTQHAPWFGSVLDLAFSVEHLMGRTISSTIRGFQHGIHRGYTMGFSMPWATPRYTPWKIMTYAMVSWHLSGCAEWSRDVPWALPLNILSVVYHACHGATMDTTMCLPATIHGTVHGVSREHHEHVPRLTWTVSLNGMCHDVCTVGRTMGKAMTFSVECAMGDHGIYQGNILVCLLTH